MLRFDLFFIVIEESTQTRMDLSGLGTTTMGEAHANRLIGFKMPSLLKLSI
jgi:hypothetical protein